MGVRRRKSPGNADLDGSPIAPGRYGIPTKDVRLSVCKVIVVFVNIRTSGNVNAKHTDGRTRRPDAVSRKRVRLNKDCLTGLRSVARQTCLTPMTINLRNRTNAV